MTAGKTAWRDNGVRIVRHDQPDLDVPSWPGMSLRAAISHASAGANKIWAGSVTIPPDARTGAHHHGELESVIYVVRGRARLRWGERLEYFADAGPGELAIEAVEAPEEVSWVDPHHPPRSGHP
jgi:uncharacterized RmlC-like cupin family protein